MSAGGRSHTPARLAPPGGQRGAKRLRLGPPGTRAPPADRRQEGALPEAAVQPLPHQPGQQEEQEQLQVSHLPDPLQGTGRLLRALHPGLPVLRVPDAVQHRAGLRHVRLLLLGRVLLLLLLRLRRVRRLRPALRHGLRHHRRLLRVGRLPRDLHGVLRPLLLVLSRAVLARRTRSFHTFL